MTKIGKVALAAVVSTAMLPTFGNIVFENVRMKLVVGDDAKVESLVVKATGEEMVAPGGRLPLMTAEQDRPYHNEVKLIHPNKHVVYPAKAVRRKGDVLTVDFDREPFSAEFDVKLTDDYLAFTFRRIVFDRVRGYGMLRFDRPPVVNLKAMQLKLRERKYFGDWLNVVWDDSNAAAVVSASPHPEIDHDDADGAKVLYGRLLQSVRMTGAPVALVVGSGKEDFLDAMDALERDYGLPRGVRSRRQKLINASIYSAGSFEAGKIDTVIETAKRGGFRLMKVYYASLVKESGTWSLCGDYDIREDRFPGGLSDISALVDKVKAAGIVPGLHFLQTHVGMRSRYVAPVADPRLNKRMRFTLAKALPEGTADVAEVEVEERTCEAPTYEPCRVLQFGGELLSYESASSEPPYRFFGVKRGAWGTRPQAHEAGQVGGILDMSEFGAPGSCYLDQNSSLQDEVADKIARLYNCGFGFVYMDGSEGVPPPCGVNVALAQYRVWRKLKGDPLFAEGAAKSHFSWHMLSGANAFDGPAPENFKDFMMRWQVAQAPLVAQDMTRCDFGWWSMQRPGASIWWMGPEETIGTQPDMWEFGEALSVAWGCPASCSGLDGWQKHPRGADILEVMRRWEDVRDRGLLTPSQVEKFRALRPGNEVTLLIGAKGEYVFRDIVPITIAGDKEGRRFRAFAFTEGDNKTVVSFWCGDKASRGLILPGSAPRFVWRDEYAGKELRPGRTADGCKVIASSRQYLFFDAGLEAVRKLLEAAKPEDPCKGVDVDAVRRRVAAKSEENRRRFDELNAEYKDESRTSVEREAARVAMLSLLNDERTNLKELRQYAKGDELAAIAAKMSRLLAIDKRLCGWE